MDLDMELVSVLVLKKAGELGFSLVVGVVFWT